MTANAQQASIYTDFSGLNALRAQAQNDKDAALKEVAKQFESLFMSQLMKSMRDANQVFAEDGLFNSQRTQFYQQMFDSQLTQSLAAGQGMGLSQALYQQLSRQIPGVGDETDAGGPRPRSIQDYGRDLPPPARELPQGRDRVSSLAEDVMPDRPAGSTAPARFETPRDFVAHMMPMAREIAGKAGIDPSVVVAQAALETGWGRHMIEGEGGRPSHNLFGIKADARWAGDAVQITTTEYRDGLPVREQAAFRAYSDYRDSMKDYVDFLQNNPRYREVLEQAQDPEAFARALDEAGYATDPAYGRKIQRLMNGEWIQSALDQGGSD